MVDATITKAQRFASGARGSGEEDLGRSRGGLTTKIHVLVDRRGRPLCYLLTPGQAADCRHAATLLEDVAFACLIGDRAYDSDDHDARVRATYGIELVAPHRRGRKRKPTQDARALRRYKRRWKVERTFAWLANSRRLVNRWERNPLVYEGFLSLACTLITLRRF